MYIKNNAQIIQCINTLYLVYLSIEYALFSVYYNINKTNQPHSNTGGIKMNTHEAYLDLEEKRKKNNALYQLGERSYKEWIAELNRIIQIEKCLFNL